MTQLPSALAVLSVEQQSSLLWFGYGSILHLVAFGLVALHCLRNRREATSALLWMFVAWGFPLIGPLIFLMFGINRVPLKVWRKRTSDVKFLHERHAREHGDMPLAYWRSVRTSVAAEPPQPALRSFNGMLNHIVPDYPLLGHNRIEPLVTGDQAFPQMLDAIRKAKHHIHLQTFILGNDDVAREFMEALRARAEAGVTVRVLYDRFGSTPAVFSGLIRRYRRIPNMQVVGWTQVNPFKRQFQANLRNHRKVLVLDGRRAFVGGINLAANNRTRDGNPADRDFHFEVHGPIVQELQYAFLGDWYFMTDDAPEVLLCENHFPRLPHGTGTALIRLVNGSPATDVDELTDACFTAITTAQRTLYAATPYFVPPIEIVCAFRAAALRGVDVRLVVPEHNNHLYAGLASRALYAELLAAGVRIFERQPPFLHAKAMVVDDELSIVGTANLDVRSLRLNYESNLMVFDAPFAVRLNLLLQEDFTNSREIHRHTWSTRSKGQKLAENFCSLLTPVL